MSQNFLFKLRCCFKRMKEEYNNFRLLKKATYRIVDDDTSHEIITFSCNHLRTPFTCRVTEVISDLTIIKGLLPEEACYLGIRYGIYFANSIEANKVLARNPPAGFYLNYQTGRYKINYEDRHGNVCYMDSISHDYFTKDPRQIAIDANVISYFDSLQACYIGILAGIKSVKSKNRLSSPVKLIKKHLRLLNLSK